MKRSTDRILTTHVGSLARPKDLLEVITLPFRHGRHRLSFGTQLG